MHKYHNRENLILVVRKRTPLLEDSLIMNTLAHTVMCTSLFNCKSLQPSGGRS